MAFKRSISKWNTKITRTMFQLFKCAYLVRFRTYFFHLKYSSSFRLKKCIWNIKTTPELEKLFSSAFEWLLSQAVSHPPSSLQSPFGHEHSASSSFLQSQACKMLLLFPQRPDLSVGCPKKYLADKPPLAAPCALLPVLLVHLHLPAVLSSCQPKARGAGSWLCALLSASLSSY